MKITLQRFNDLLKYQYMADFADFLIYSALNEFLKKEYPMENSDSIFDIPYMRDSDLIAWGAKMIGTAIFDENVNPVFQDSNMFGVSSENTLPGMLLLELTNRLKAETDRRFRGELSALAQMPHGTA